MKTISRTSTRVIAEIKAKNLVCRVFSLRNDFHAREVDAAFAWGLLAEGRAKLRDNENGTYTITVHSNEWYELQPRG
jgi:hypothetical protein